MVIYCIVAVRRHVNHDENNKIMKCCSKEGRKKLNNTIKNFPFMFIRIDENNLNGLHVEEGKREWALENKQTFPYHPPNPIIFDYFEHFSIVVISLLCGQLISTENVLLIYLIVNLSFIVYLNVVGILLFWTWLFHQQSIFDLSFIRSLSCPQFCYTKKSLVIVWTVRSD